MIESALGMENHNPSNNATSSSNNFIMINYNKLEGHIIKGHPMDGCLPGFFLSGLSYFPTDNDAESEKFYDILQDSIITMFKDDKIVSSDRKLPFYIDKVDIYGISSRGPVSHPFANNERFKSAILFNSCILVGADNNCLANDPSIRWMIDQFYQWLDSPSTPLSEIQKLVLYFACKMRYPFVSCYPKVEPYSNDILIKSPDICQLIREHFKLSN